MSSDVLPTTAELLRRIHAGWKAFLAFLRPISEEALTQPTDAAGWTAKDHIIHISVWEKGILALLNKESRNEAMGVDADTWKLDFETINAAIQQQNKDLSLAQVMQTLEDTHQKLVAKIETLADEDLMRSYQYYQPDPKRTDPVLHWLVGDTYAHYDEHIPWMMVIIADAVHTGKNELMQLIEMTWQDFNSYLRSLSEAQLTQLTDDGGWTIKDHLMHLVVWEEGMLPLLEGVPRRESMKLDKTLFDQGIDAVNADLQQRYSHLSLAEVFRAFEDVHQRVIEKVGGMSEEALHLPYKHYFPDTNREQPIILWVQGSTYGHYGKHIPWIKKMVEDAS